MSGAAAAAAAARRRKLLEEKEEEEMTPYGSDDLIRDWEFKIVRANRPVFRNPKHLNRLLEQEARAGWTMVEKFDDQRVRFKRLREIGLDQPGLQGGIDPYRTHYGMSPGAFGALTVLAILAVVGSFMTLIVFLTR